MKIILALLLTILLASCSSVTPAPVTVTLGTEFTLAANQTATIEDTNLTIKLIGVTDDQRCPSEIECAASGPVSLSLSAQIGDSEPTDINLQVFTSNNGRAPDMQFEGIEDRAIFEGYLIRVVSVLPYPAKTFDEISASEYRVIFIVSKAE
jgi:hypothetical protein